MSAFFLSVRFALIVSLLAACSPSRQEQCKRWADRRCACALEQFGQRAWENELHIEDETIDYCMTSDYGYAMAKQCTRAETCRAFRMCDPDEASKAD